jgi:hypothetical protein
MQQGIERKTYSEIIIPDAYGESESIARWKVEEEEDLEVPWILRSQR